MLNQFSRTQLLIGKEAMDRLSKTRVAIFGIGGVGGYTAEALARSGVGELDLIDDDKVCLTNINRQIFATRKTVGKYKVDVAEERLKDINPDIIINKHRTFYTPETSPAQQLLSLLSQLFIGLRIPSIINSICSGLARTTCSNLIISSS